MFLGGPVISMYELSKASESFPNYLLEYLKASKNTELSIQ